MSTVQIRRQITTEDFTRIRSQFDYLDQDGNGQISVEEAIKVLAEKKIACDRQSIINMIQKADKNFDGVCSWAEFLALMMELQCQEEKNHKEFNLFDRDGDGKISFSEMVDLFKVRAYLIIF